MKTLPESTPQAPLDLAEFRLDDDEWLSQARRADTGQGLDVWMSYEILSPALRGGQAMVYRCRRSDGAVVAVKRIHGGAAAAPSAKRRLQRELDIAASLTHPNIASARTVNVGDELLLETDWIDGRPLTDWCVDAGEGSPTDFQAVLRVMIAVCDAVQFAHERGVIHRDLKPSNILVDGDGRPHILDFGLAGTLAEFASDVTHVTLSEPLVGTPAYASPEQIAGDPSRVDARTDVYSLGVLLYEAFTGLSPYPRNLSLGRLLHAVEHLDPPRPRVRNSAVPRNVEAVILQAMRKTPSERYATVTALRDDLQRCLEGSQPAARPPGLWFDLRAFAKRNPTFTWLTACVACALLATGFMIAAYAARLARAQDDTLAAHRAAERANQILADMVERAVPPIDDAGVRLGSVLDSTARWLDDELRNEPWALARAHVSIGSLYAKAERWAEADRHLSRAIDDYRRLGDPDRTTVAQALRLLGLARAYLGHSDSVDRQREAMTIARRVRQADSTEIANFHAALAETLLVAGGPAARPQADAEIERAVSLLQNREERFPAWEAELISGYARALMHAGDNRAAVQRLLQASSLFEQARMPIDTCPYHRASLARLAAAYESVGDVEAASRVRRRLEEVRERATSIPPYTTGD